MDNIAACFHSIFVLEFFGLQCLTSGKKNQTLISVQNVMTVETLQYQK